MTGKGDRLVVLITATDEGEAGRISDLLLQKRKAACINIVPSVSSGFWWEGKLEHEQESLLICKTLSTVLPELIELVKSVHSNEVPEIIALPIVAGSDDYLAWMEEEIAP